MTYILNGKNKQTNNFLTNKNQNKNNIITIRENHRAIDGFSCKHIETETNQN